MPSVTRRTLIVNLVLGGVILAGLAGAGLVLAGSGPGEPEPTTAEVRRGTVVGTVAASGQVASPGDVGLDFATAGTIVEVSVGVGERVTEGQVLGRLDDTAFLEQVESAEAAKNAAVATRAQLRAGITAQERRVLELERDQAGLQFVQAQEALELAERQRDAALSVLDEEVDAAERALDRARDARSDIEDEVGCNSPDNLSEVQACIGARDRVQEALAGRRAARESRTRSRIQQDQTLAQAREQVDRARVAFDLAGARMAAQSAGPRQGDTAQADAEVTRTRVQLAQAQRELEDTVLRAPVAGVVAEVNARAGTMAAAASGQSPAILLTDVQGREVSALFSEADATRVQIGQAAVVSFDALPGVSVNGRVLRIDPHPTLTASLVQYAVHIEVDDLPDEIRIGQTTTTEIVVGEADDVLYVPNTAVSTVGARTTVTVFDGEQQREREVVVGIRGDQHVEIESGLAEGELVVLPTRGAGTLPDIFGPGGAGEPSTEPARGD